MEHIEAETTKLVETCVIPAFLSYFNSLANNGIGIKTRDSVTIYLAPTDRRVYDNLDEIRSITLTYNKDVN